jgi:hypothetical protein
MPFKATPWQLQVNKNMSVQLIPAQLNAAAAENLYQWQHKCCRI